MVFPEFKFQVRARFKVNIIFNEDGGATASGFTNRWNMRVVIEVIAVCVTFFKPGLREAQDIESVNLSKETLQCRVLCSKTPNIDVHDTKTI